MYIYIYAREAETESKREGGRDVWRIETIYIYIYIYIYI